MTFKEEIPMLRIANPISVGNRVDDPSMHWAVRTTPQMVPMVPAKRYIPPSASGISPMVMEAMTSMWLVCGNISSG